MPDKHGAGFAEAIEAAQRGPTAPSGDMIDAASPFPMPLPAGHRVVDGDQEGRIPGVVALVDYQAHAKVYNVANAEDCAAYEETLNEILNGSAILRYEERHFTKEGDPLVLMCWMTYTPRPKREGEDAEDDEDVHAKEGQD